MKGGRSSVEGPSPRCSTNLEAELDAHQVLGGVLLLHDDEVDELLDERLARERRRPADRVGTGRRWRRRRRRGAGGGWPPRRMVLEEVADKVGRVGVGLGHRGALLPCAACGAGAAGAECCDGRRRCSRPSRARVLGGVTRRPLLRPCPSRPGRACTCDSAARDSNDPSPSPSLPCSTSPLDSINPRPQWYVPLART